nr:DUF3306 domain-containing protein [Massilia sp. 9096]
MADVALLTPESDFSAFVRQGVDADVRRTALKKLFTDPHFNTMDRLDIYIDDYNKPSPMSDAMLASLRHAKSVFRHLDQDDEAAVDAAAADTAAAVAHDTAVLETQAPPLEAHPIQDLSAPESDRQPQTLQQAAPQPVPHMPPHPPAADTYQQYPPETETR